MKSDRLSTLQDELIYHILAFLDAKGVVRTCILSNRWRRLWLCAPTLIFDCENLPLYCDVDNCYEPPTCSECNILHNKAVSFVDRMFIFSKVTNLSKFELNFVDSPVDSSHLYTWLVAVLGNHAQEIILVAESDKPLDLPHHLFSPNIRVLEMNFLGGAIVRLPNSFGKATNLKTLKLCSVVFPHGNSDGEFILSCPALKKLQIRYCDISHLRVFIISTHLLESLKLLSMIKKKECTSMVKTCTPNFKRIEVEIYGYDEEYESVNFRLENLVALVSASISFGCIEDFPTEECARPLVQVLTGIYNVQSLTISELCVQLLAYFPESTERLLKLLQNLRCVMVRDAYKIVSLVQIVQAILVFMERWPHVETLVWERDLDRETENLTFQNKFSCLKKFEYRNFLSDEVELKILGYFLLHGIVLEEAIIKSARLSSLYGNHEQFKEKLLSLSLHNESLLSLPRASASASVSFQLRS